LGQSQVVAGMTTGITERLSRDRRTSNLAWSSTLSPTSSQSFAFRPVFMLLRVDCRRPGRCDRKRRRAECDDEVARK